MLRGLKKYIRRKLGLDAEIEKLTKQVSFLASFYNLSAKNTLEPNSVIKNQLTSFFKGKYRINGFDFSIHKNDIMFQHHLYHHATEPEVAFKSYYHVGVDIASKCQAISNSHNLGNPATVLDFGSGYGRASRFFSHFFPKSKVLVSEVKPLALDFQKSQFGYEPVLHNAQANSFPDFQVDLICASSVFTHLPNANFEEWFVTLSKTLKPGGILIFSFNNITRIAKPQSIDFHYTSQSEDSAFWVEDRLGDAEHYGLTFVSKDYLLKLASSISMDLTFQDEMTFGKQEIVAIQNKTPN